MENKINIKSILALLPKLIVFLLCMFIVWEIFGFIKPYMVNGLSAIINKKSTVIENIISLFLGLLDLGISTMTTSFIESIFAAQQDFPRVFLFSPQGRVQNVSGIKTMHNFNSHLCVEIGNRQPRFRIVYARIKNTGKSIISECLINRQKISVMLDPDQSSELYFIIYEDSNFTKTGSNFKFPYCIRDDQGNTYIGKYSMKVDYDKSIATFRSLKKMKRSILKNALSNL